MDRKIKVLLAIGQKEIEDWLQNKLAQYCDFVGTALHREQVLDMINTTMPDVIILDVSLPTRQMSEMSVDLLIQKIKTTYKSCRPIVICGSQVPGDELLTRLVSRGVYDIAYGEKVKIQDVCDMIFNPRDYSYAAPLQELDTVDDKSVGLSKPKIVEQIKEQPEGGQNRNYGQNYGQETETYPRNGYQQNTNTYVQEAPTQDTSVLTADMAGYGPNYGDNVGDTSVLTSGTYGPRGIIFQPVEKNQIVTAGSGSVVSYNGEGYRTNNILKGPAPVIKHGKTLVFTAARQGVGCTSSAINTAYAFAMEGKKVLLLDATFGRSCIYQKLGLPENYGNTVEDVLRAYAGGQNISQMPLSRPQIKISDGKRPEIPDTLKFLRFSENYNCFDELSYFGEALDNLSQYFDYIIADTMMNNAPVINELMKRAVKVIVVVLQDIYEVNTAYQMVTLLDGDSRIQGKVIPLVNRTVRRGVPEAELVKGVFSSTECFMIPEDTFGFMRAYSVGKAYYLFAKRRTQDKYLDIMTRV